MSGEVSFRNTPQGLSIHIRTETAFLRSLQRSDLCRRLSFEKSQPIAGIFCKNSQWQTQISPSWLNPLQRESGLCGLLAYPNGRLGRRGIIVLSPRIGAPDHIDLSFLFPNAEKDLATPSVSAIFKNYLPEAMKNGYISSDIKAIHSCTLKTSQTSQKVLKEVGMSMISETDSLQNYSLSLEISRKKSEDSVHVEGFNRESSNFDEQLHQMINDLFNEEK